MLSHTWVHFNSILALLTLSIPLSSQTRADDLWDPLEPSAAFDIETNPEVPLAIELMRLGALKLSDGKLREHFTAEVRSLQKAIAQGLESTTNGYLVKVEIYTDEFGTPDVPGGQLIFPVGEGKTPIDALAEYMRVPRYASPPRRLKDESYYIWFKREGPELKASAIRREWREVFERSAFDENRRRTLLGIVREADPNAVITAARRAEYWNDVANKHIGVLRSKREMERVMALVEEFKRAQTDFNNLYREYQVVDARLSEQRSLVSVLSIAGSIAGIVSEAVKSGKVVSAADKESKVRIDQKPREEWRVRLEYEKNEANLQEGQLKQLRIKVETKGNELQRYNQTLEDAFKGQPIPKSTDTLIVRP